MYVLINMDIRIIFAVFSLLSLKIMMILKGAVHNPDIKAYMKDDNE